MFSIFMGIFKSTKRHCMTPMVTEIVAGICLYSNFILLSEQSSLRTKQPNTHTPNHPEQKTIWCMYNWKPISFHIHFHFYSRIDKMNKVVLCIRMIWYGSDTCTEWICVCFSEKYVGNFWAHRERTIVAKYVFHWNVVCTSRMTHENEKKKTPWSSDNTYQKRKRGKYRKNTKNKVQKIERRKREKKK